LNKYRTAAGLPTANLSAAIDLAAQTHATYNGLNNNGANNPNADPIARFRATPVLLAHHSLTA
jgi:hypothetical protein